MLTPDEKYLCKSTTQPALLFLFHENGWLRTILYALHGAPREGGERQQKNIGPRIVLQANIDSLE